jgi:hypothetical protein
VWEELEQRGATIATMPFSGRAGIGGMVGTIALSRIEGSELVDVERGPAAGTSSRTRSRRPRGIDTVGSPAGRPWIRGTVTWLLTDRSVVIVGKCAGEAFEETVT